MTLFCWYYGNQGRNNIDSMKPATPQTSYLYGGDNIGIDSNLDIGDFTANDFGESNFDSVEIFENLIWGEGYIRPIPQIRVGNLQKFAVDNPSAKISYA